MLDDARTLLAEEGMEEEEQLKFIEELTAELEGKELQERGATLVDILEELQARARNSCRAQFSDRAIL